MLTADEFLGIVRGSRNGEGKNPYVKMGKVASLDGNGVPSIVFDGEEQPSVKHYPYLSSYTPTVDDRVLLVVAGNTYVVIGKIV